jgi:hypothetical protein
MSPILSWGLDIIRGVQGAASPLLTSAMKGLSLTASEYCLILLLPLLYWCVDKRRGIRIGLLVFASTAINLGLKSAFTQPRPYELDPSVGMAKEATFGLPSGHAQTSTVFWGSAAPLFRAPWGLVLAIALPLLVGLSRVYLGVHFPTDVFAGWAIGAAIVLLDREYGDRIGRALSKLRPSLAMALVAAIALLMNVITKNDTSVSGAFFGLAAAWIYAEKSAPFSVEGSLGKRTLRYIFGLATVAIVYLLPKLLLASIEAGGPPILRFLRYAVLGAWVAGGAPWLFIKLGLAGVEPSAESEDHSASEKDESVISK